MWRRLGAKVQPQRTASVNAGDRGREMWRGWRVVVGLAAAGAVMVVGAGTQAAAPPLWAQHVQNYDGGISNGVRARFASTRGQHTGLTPHAKFALNNVQMNADCEASLPQNETSVAIKASDPLIAVAAANDWCGDGFWIGRSTDGGKTWASTFKDPKTSIGTRCFGSDPSIVNSARDQAFYLSSLCWFEDGSSEVQVWKSADDGATWTDSLKASLVISNRTANTWDQTFFYDKELLAVDNNPSSAHYGRLYITYIKFHLTPPNGRSDYCPVQTAYTDRIPTNNPASATWNNVSVVPDAPFKDTGPSANQWAMPIVDTSGALDIAYALEDCNTAIDRAFFFTRSTDGGNTFSSPVQIDKPGQFADNPNRKDKLNPKKFNPSISPSLVFNPVTNSLSFAYQNNVNRQASGADISVQQSRDFGATWSDAKTISTTASGAAAPNDQFFPALAVDETGNLHAIWYDNRNDPYNRLIETFQAFSSDDGSTWTNWDISSTPWNPDEAFFNCGCFIGDYNAIAASTAAVYPVWTDGRNSAGRPNGQTDIFTNVELGGIQAFSHPKTVSTDSVP
jgi:hypothetical protein